MNQGIYRLIFNKARGCVMVANEHTRSASKDSNSPTGKATALMRQGLRSYAAKLKKLTFGLLCVSGAVSIAPLAQAQIVTDSTAPASQQATVTNTANGTPQVDIAAPSAGGVSHNVYTQFDVNQQGVVLNNSQGITQTQQAGLIQGNANLANGTASVILNEVNSANPSHLNGFIEVAGDRADVIVANPSGISCSGCGFINVQSGTLTTGTPTVENGQLQGYQVTGGQVTIGEGGLDARETDYTHIIAQSVQVNAAIVAQRLRVTTGNNQVNADNTVVTALDNTSGASPDYAIDVAALGGMYAGQITLIGTEDGVGVRNSGELGASTGEFTLTADGQLVNTGSITATQNTNLNTAGLDNRGVVHSGGNTLVDTQGDLNNDGTLSAYGSTQINASGSVQQSAQGGMGAGINAYGEVVDAEAHTGTANLSVTAGDDITLSGNQVATHGLALDAQNITLNQAAQQAQAIQLSAEESVTATGAVQTTDTLAVDAAEVQLNHSDIQAQAMTAEASQGDLDLSGSLVTVSGTLDLDARDQVTTDEAAITTQQLQVDATTLSNQGGELLASDRAMLDVSQTLNNQGGVIQANNGLAVTAGQVENQSGELVSLASLTLDSQSLNNQGGQIVSEDDARLTTTTLNNSAGLIQSNQAIDIDTQGHVLTNTHSGLTGGLVAGEGIRLSSGELDNNNGYIGANGDTSIQTTGAFHNEQGEMATTGELSLNANALDNREGLIQSGEDVAMTITTTLDNQQGRIGSSGNLNVSAQTLNNAQGSVRTDGDLTLNTNQLLNQAGEVTSHASLVINSGELDNQDGTIVSDANAQLTTTALNNDAGLIQSNRDLTLDTQGETLTNTNSGTTGGLVAGQALQVSTGDLNNQRGYIGASETATILASGELDNQQGVVSSADDLSVQATTVNNTEGRLQSAGSVDLDVSTELSNQQGRVVANDTLSIQAAMIDNQQTDGDGLGLEGAQVNLVTERLNNEDGQVIADNLSLQVQDSLNNRRGVLSASDTLAIADQNGDAIGQFDNAEGRVIAGQSLSVNSQVLQGEGEILSQGTAEVSLQGDYTHVSDFIANAGLTLNLTGALNNQALLAATGDLNIIAASLINAQGGELSGTNTQLRVTGTLTNYGLINSAGLTRLDAQQLDNTGTGRIYGDHIAIQAGTLNNVATDGQAAVIAARHDMQLGVGTLNNRDHSVLFSDGDVAIGGSLVNDQASGNATQITNASATIEAMGDMTIHATRLDNQNLNLVTDVVTTTESISEYSYYYYNDETPTDFLSPIISSTRYTLDGDNVYIQWDGPDNIPRLWTPGATRGQHLERFIRYSGTRTTTETVIVETDPGVLSAGGNITLVADTIVNDNSHITAGLTLNADADSVENISVEGERRITETGTATKYWRRNRNGRDQDRRTPYDYTGPDNLSWVTEDYTVIRDDESGPYEVVLQRDIAVTGDARVETVPLASAVFQSNSNQTQGTQISDLGDHTLNETIEGVSDREVVTRDAAALSNVDAVSTSGPVRINEVSQPNGVVRQLALAANLSNNSLFQQNPSPTATYLIETDPAFTNQNAWLSSEYILLQLDYPALLAAKRLGDGFYEQRLIREQVLELTGRRFIDDYSDDETQYQALMDNGLTFAQEHDLIPGVKLTADQMAQLTTDIVWLQMETVTLADGSTQEVLVPRVYALVQEGDLTGTGGLMSGNNVNLNVNQLVNSNGILAREGVDIHTQSLRDTGGRIQANRITTFSSEDTVLTGSRWEARESLDVRADRDLTLDRETRSTDLHNGTRTRLGEKTQLFVSGPTGSASLSAGRDLTVTGSDIVNDGTGTTRLQAGNDLRIDTATETERLQQGNFSHSRDTVHGSHIEGQGDVDLIAESEFTVHSVSIKAGQTITIRGDEVTITADANNLENRVKQTGHRQEEKTTTHQLSQLSARGVSIVSGGDLNLEGTTVTAEDTIALKADGATTIAAVQDQDYRFNQSSKKRSFGRSESKLTERYRTTNVGGTLSAENITINSEINNDGSTTADRDAGSVTLNSAQLNAEQQIAIAGENVDINALKEVDSLRQETQKSGFGGLSKSRQGSIKRQEILQASEVFAQENNLDVFSASSISINGSALISGGDLNLTAVDDVLIGAERVLEESKNWSQKTRLNPVSLETVYERDDHVAGQGNATAIGSLVQSGGSTNIEASRVRIEGSDVVANEHINVTTDVGDIEIVAATENHQAYQKDTTATITREDMIEQMVDEVEYTLDVNSRIQEIGTDDEKNQATWTVAQAQYDQVDSKNQTLGHRASSLVANGNINLNAAGDVDIQGSDLAADADQNQDGDLNLAAGGDVSITETSTSRDSQTKEVHGSGELSVVVQHQAVEIVQAAKAVEEAKDQLKDAKEDYRQYQKDVKNLKKQRNALRAEFEQGVPGILYEDIIEMNDLIDELESDKEWYQAGVALAAANLASKVTLLIQQSVAGAASTATWGFNAGVQLDLEASTSDRESHQETSRGSQLSGNNITITTGDGGDITATETLVRGSTLVADNNLNINTGDLRIEASRDDSNSKNDSQSAQIRIAQTLYGAAGGPTVSVDYTRSRSKDGDSRYNNSQLNAGNINLNSTGDTTIKGANVHADDSLNMNVGGDLLVQSMQNRYSAESNSLGVSGGLSLGADNNAADNGKTASGATRNIGQSNGQVSSVNGGLNVGSGRTRSKETVLTSLTGGNVNINVGGHTGQVGSVIAAVDTDEDGNQTDNGNLTLNTQSYDFVDLSNTHFSNQRSAGISTSVSVSGGTNVNDPNNNNKTDADGDKDLRVNTSHITYSNSSNYQKDKSLATLGNGTVTIRDDEEDGTDSTARLNRDIENTTKDFYDVDREQGNVDLTIDHRLLSESGRDQIAEDFLKANMVTDAISDIIQSERLNAGDFASEIRKNRETYDAIKNVIASDPTLAAMLQSPNLTPEQKQRMLNQVTNSVMVRLGYSEYENHIIATTEPSNGGGQVAGFFSSETGDAYINDIHNHSTADLLTTMGHEAAHAMDYQDAQNNGEVFVSEEAYAEDYGNDMAAYTDRALDMAGYGSMASSNNHVGNNSATVQSNNVAFSQLDKNQGSNYLAYEESRRLSDLQRQLLVGNLTSEEREKAKEEIVQLQALDKERDRRVKAACQVASSAACTQVTEELANFAQGYLEAGVSSNPRSAPISVSQESDSVISQLSENTSNLHNEAAYNIEQGLKQFAQEGVDGTLELLDTIAGLQRLDPEAFAKLASAYIALEKFKDDPVDQTKQVVHALQEEWSNIELQSQSNDPEERAIAAQRRTKFTAEMVSALGGIAAPAYVGGKIIVKSGSNSAKDHIATEHGDGINLENAESIRSNSNVEGNGGIDYLNPTVTVNGVPVEPSHYGMGYHGTSGISVEDIIKNGLPSKGENFEMVEHVVRDASDSGLRGTSPYVTSPVDKSNGPIGFAGENGVVVEIDGMPAYDANQLLEGRVQNGHEFGDNVYSQEMESSIPSLVPTENIRRIGIVDEDRRGNLRIIEWIENPNYIEKVKSE